MFRGVTLPELLAVLVLVGVMASVAIPPLVRQLDRVAVEGAADRYAVLHEATRQLAIARGTLARVELDAAARTATISWRSSSTTWDTVEFRRLGSVNLDASQSVITFNPIGVGFGLSNSRIVFSRDAAAETLTVSRTGRLRRN